MAVDKGENWFVEKRDFTHIIILLAIAIGIGIYLIATTALIAKDGISYINYAKALAVAPVETINDCSAYAPSSYTPGYPFLILMTHKLVKLFGSGSSVLSWIYSAQTITLLCRVLALIPLYFIGKEFVGGKLSFWAILILVILPYPARFGSDTLRDWPHILFLATGFLFLLWATMYRKLLMFGLVGIVAGLGYLVRPMCAQLVVYGVSWLTYSIFRPKFKSSVDKRKLIGGLALLVIGFAVVATPYMVIRGEIMPDRLRRIIESFSSCSDNSEIHEQDTSNYTAELMPGNITEAFGKLIGRISENLMYYFVPALFIGMYYRFRRKPKSEVMFFITAFISLNIAALILRYCCCGPALSKRYVLPLVTFTIFFVPAGLQITSTWLEAMLSKGAYLSGLSQNKLYGWFFVLLIIGIGICMPKLFRPIRVEKKGYRLAAEWLKKNTAENDVIVVPDNRISFYAERNRGKNLGSYLPANVKYVVKIVNDQEKTPAEMTEVWSSYLNEKKNKDKIVIYQRI